MSARSSRRHGHARSSCSGSALAAGRGGGGTEPHVPTTAALSASTVSLAAIGQTAQLTATITDQNGNAIGSPALAWTSANTAVVTVSSSGLVTATGNGTTVVTVSAGSASAHADVTVAQVPSQLQKVAGDGQTATPGQPVAVPLTIQVNDASGSPVANVAVTLRRHGRHAGHHERLDRRRRPRIDRIRPGRDGRAAGDRVGREHVAHDQFHGNRRVAIRHRVPVPHHRPRRPRWRRSRRRGSGGRASSSATLPNVSLDAPAGNCGDELAGHPPLGGRPPDPGDADLDRWRRATCSPRPGPASSRIDGLAAGD